MAVVLPDISFAERMKVLVEKAGSAEKLASKAGMSSRVIGKYLNGESDPSRSRLVALANAAEVDLVWLAVGDKGGPGGDRQEGVVAERPQGWMSLPSLDARQVAEAAQPHRREDDRYCYIPLYDVRASAGGGAMVDQENVLDFLSFKADWIRSQLYASPNDLYLIHVEGESMEPTLRPGDVILVDHREASTLPRDGIYVMRMDGTLLVKRLQRLPGGIVNVTSDNAAYQPFTVTLGQETNEANIVGRVVWCGRRM